MRRPFTFNVLKGFSVFGLLLSPLMFVVGCGADPAGDTPPTTPDAATEPAPASDGSGQSATPPAGGSDSK
ncbi:MAG: hypothetical protein ABJZ55_11820 [Fuerstiella sp.]